MRRKWVKGVREGLPEKVTCEQTHKLPEKQDLGKWVVGGEIASR